MQSYGITLRTDPEKSDIAAIRSIVTSTNAFRPDEIDVAIELIEEDDDYDSDGSLKEDIRLDYEDKYGESDFIDEIKEDIDSDDED